MTSICRAGSDVVRATALALLVACDSTYGDNGPTEAGPSIQVAVSPAIATVQAGTVSFVDVTVTRNGGYRGLVTLTASDLPPDVSATITPATLTGTAATARIQLTAPAIAPGTRALVKVSAFAQGANTASTTFQLDVTTLPAYSLNVTPGGLGLVPGASGSFTVQIQRVNFTGAVTVGLLNPPTGIAGAVNPAAATGDVAALAISVAPSVAPGTYPLAIQGTTTEITSRTATLDVTVLLPPSVGSNVQYLYCSAQSVPTFFAYQDGTGPWLPVSPTAANGVTRFSFNLAQGRGGVVSVFKFQGFPVLGRGRRSSSLSLRGPLFHSPPAMRSRTDSGALFGEQYGTEVLYGTTAELAQDGFENCALTLPSRKVMGAVTGIQSGQYGIMSLGGAINIFDGAVATNPVKFEDVRTGLVDFVGSRVTNPGQAADRIVLFRHLNIPATGALPSPIDFNGPASLAPATAAATLTGGGSDDLEMYVELITSNGALRLWSDMSPTPVSTRPWIGLVPSATVASDYYSLTAFASASDETLGVTGYRVSSKYVGGPVADQAMTFGPPMIPGTVTLVAGGGYPRYRFEGLIPPEYAAGSASVEVTGSDDFSSSYYFFIATNAYLAAKGNPLLYDFVMPDFTSVPGFPIDSRLVGGINGVATSAVGFSGPGIFYVRPNVGSVSREALRYSTITVP